tara:strand:+ start:771 stop:1226 length:456 start_codon:yes stop_codon:yes gene_type:complete
MSILSLLQTTIPRAAMDRLSMDRINEYAQSLPEDQVDNFYETAMLARRQRSTPSFIYEENYPKTSGGLFADSYDPDSKVTISKENLDREANAFLDLLNSEKMQGFNEAQYNDAFSPNINDFLQRLMEFKQEFGFAPLNVKELEAKARIFDT